MAKSLRGVWLISLCLLLVSCGQSTSLVDAPQAVEGQLDLRDWDFNSNGMVDLAGEWEFYWQELLSPLQVETVSKSQIVSVPDTWTNYEVNGHPLPVEGYATYRLEVQLPDLSQLYELFIDGQGTAYSLWVDGKLIAQNGQVGTNAQEMVPQSKPLAAIFQPESDITEFVIQISNWQHRKAGFRNEIQLGLPEQIHDQQSNARSFEAALMGIYLVMAVYHLSIYWFRPSDKSPLYFSLLGLLYFLRTGLLNQKLLLLLLPAMSWGTALRLEYLTFYMVAPIYALFVRSLYPNDVPRWALRAITVLGFGFAVYMLFVDTLTASYTVTPYQVILLIETAYFVFFIGRIVTRKRDGALYIASASLIAFIGGTLEILSLQNIIPVDVDGTITFLAFIFIQAILLSSRLSKSFHRVEVLSSELEETNVNLSESEKKYRAIFEESKDMIFVAGTDEKISDANPASEDITGYTRNELRQMKMSDILVHQQDKEKIEKTLRELAVVKDYELELRRKDGNTIHGLLTLTFRRNETGKITELQGNVHDISSRIQAQNEQVRAMIFEQLAITDPLTNIYNRRVFDEMAVKEWQRAKRTKSPLATVLFDVDRFKHVNDTYGHLVGDQILINLSKLCSDNLRSMDIFARYGGEEFVILMPDTNADAAYQSMERLRTMIEKTSLGKYEGAALFITISVGIVVWDGEGSLDIRALLSRADQALYSSKEAGRNRTTIWKNS